MLLSEPYDVYKEKCVLLIVHVSFKNVQALFGELQMQVDHNKSTD